MLAPLNIHTIFYHAYIIILATSLDFSTLSESKEIWSRAVLFLELFNLFEAITQPVKICSELYWAISISESEKSIKQLIVFNYFLKASVSLIDYSKQS